MSQSFERRTYSGFTWNVTRLYVELCSGFTWSVDRQLTTKTESFVLKYDMILLIALNRFLLVFYISGSNFSNSEISSSS